MSDSAGQVGAKLGTAVQSATPAVAAALAGGQSWLRAVLVARGVEAGALDEVLQEVATHAVAGAGSLRDQKRVEPWLYRLAVVAALQHRRRVGRRRKLATRYADSGLAPCESVETDPLNWLAAEEEQEFVRRALRLLPRRDAEILLLKYTQDWSYRELAEKLGIRAAAAEGRLRRARERMRSQLAQLAPDLAEQARTY